MEKEQLNTIDEKVSELMLTIQSDLPPKSIEYIKALSSKIEYCGETCVTAFYDYCQLELGMSSDCDDNKIDEQRLQWYKNIKV